ncbi:MAG: ABC transporter ATP-binding protein [Candidatus Melainabacteria bacterium]|nr:ABC transporter ATP-binding protein [Candidatus Melainabacteria bacterium]
MSENETVVEIKNLSKEFKGKFAVKDLSFDVKKGEILGLLGANGAGKTTTIHMLLNLITPTSGSIRIFGKDFAQSRIEILSRMNFASAYQFLPYNLKVIENLRVFAEIYSVDDAKERIAELLDLFELSHLKNNSTGMLSSGEQTRLNLCKALLNKPDLLLLDEPTASLDPDQADKVRKIILDLQRRSGMSVINTSHNMIDVHELCDRILFMQTGTVIAQGTATEIMDTYQSQSLEEVFIMIARQNDNSPNTISNI